LHGAPDLVIEILSPPTAKYDLEDKKDVYERYGVKEYWAVDPVSKQIYFFKLVKDDGLTYKEVAELLNVSIKTVESQMGIALKKTHETVQTLMPAYAKRQL